MIADFWFWFGATIAVFVVLVGGTMLFLLGLFEWQVMMRKHRRG